MICFFYYSSFFFSQSVLSTQRTFLTFSTWVYSFPRANKEFVMSVNFVTISAMVLFSFILESSNLWTRTKILDSLTLLVPLCVTCKIYHIWFADLAVDTRLNSSLFKRVHCFGIKIDRLLLFFTPSIIIGARFGVWCFSLCSIVRSWVIASKSSFYTFSSCNLIHQIMVDVV